MSIELKIPEVGESITEVVVGDWLKREGDAVRRDEALVMIETDKVTVEVPAPVNGVLVKINLTKGQAARVGDVVAVMEEGAVGAAVPATPVQRPAVQVPAVQVPAGQAKAPSQPAPRPVSAPPPATGTRVMPSAARALHDAGLAAEQVSPTGPGGRLLKEDVPAARPVSPSEMKRSSPPPAPSVPPPAGPRHGREEEVVAMTPMRRRIAERLLEAQQTAALLTTFNEVDMSELKTLRERYQNAFQEKYKIKLGMSAFFIKATIDALKQFPSVNAEVRDNNIVYKNYYDIGVAVGGGKGLVVPVVRDADQLSFAEIEQKIADFGTRAKNNTLKLDELQGGTFTITNGGVYGSLLSTPIINPPQSGILGLHGIVERPVAVAGQVVIRPMMYIALTYDHRIVDGREAVSCLRRIKEAIEQPSRMLLEV
ncbi:MAG TPA: 2-oxoglutarate dehydrogenase complex dihydrolipoyllysine-residue succinyltransferase [Polyangiaceae bacterium]|nr:2-oxoglutarate dehydrogenase complex dihydrolipoyllysine-residue succinyltransferase [Polyangiaceae bacterium]